MKNVLVFPAGSEIGLEIHKSLKDIRHFKLFGGTSVADHALYVYENMLPFLPFFDQTDFANRLNDALREHNIHYLFPAHDDLVELLPRLQVEGRINPDVQIMTSSAETCSLVRSKRKTYARLQNVVPVPRIFDSKQPQDGSFPLFAKPDRGQGSKGARMLINRNDLLKLEEKERDELVICEYLPGPEYTIDCFTDHHGCLRFAKGRLRKRTSSGISVCSEETLNSGFQEMAKAINATLDFSGMWFFQVKERANKELVLLEIAPRVSGGMGFFRAKGVNLPLLALYDREGHDITVFENDVPITRDSALYARYYFPFEFQHIYIDLDDTLILNGRVNDRLVGLMYHWKNQGKALYLITRHRDVHGLDPRQTLEKFKLQTALFDAIIEVHDKDRKSTFILYSDAIFVDDSAHERLYVHQALHIPTFTWQQAIEVLSRSRENF